MLNNYPYFVHKFGGSSLANTQRFIEVKNLLRGRNELIVVSAIQGTTSALQSSLDEAEKSMDYLQTLDALKEKHLKLAQELLSSDKNHAVSLLIQNDFFKIKDILYAIHLTNSYSKAMQDHVLGYGELWSAIILTSYLSTDRNVLFLDASRFLFVYDKEGTICIDWDKSKCALKEILKDMHFDQIVITGFIASTLDGKRTILGRNGSDFSAAIFANLFQAKELTIWTDVDGIYTADPNRVSSSFVINTMSYKEALELAYFGAKILHPMTIAPVVEQAIPIYIKNSFNPAATGTLISVEHQPSPYLIKGITCIDNVALINIEGTGMISVSGIASRVFETLHHAKIKVILISQASSEHSLCFAVLNIFAKEAVNVLTEHLQLDITRKHIEHITVDQDCAILSAVGDEMVGAIGISGKLCTALAIANINIRAISQGSSERNLSLVIKNAEIDKALQTVHSGFYCSKKTLVIGLIGPGVVGARLLEQIHHAISKLNATYPITLSVQGIMNSRRMWLSYSSINLSTWQSQFEQFSEERNLDVFVEHLLSDNAPHAVIIDCTASKIIAHQYANFLKKGIHVITPNKHANADDLDYYKKIKLLSKTNNTHYFYEATVCAGLPIITTLQDLIKTGDKIVHVEGVLSGTLSYIFNELEKGSAFSEAVFEAKKRGYTEPDPREDLSGMDVVRKLICLSREIGYDATRSNVEVYELIPKDLKECSLQEFLINLPSYDAVMAALVAKAKSKNEQLCYVGAINNQGAMQVAVKSLAQNHPFSRLEGADNMLVFHTKRYHERPLVIQGPGAGADVTAAGVFADLLRLVSFLS